MSATANLARIESTQTFGGTAICANRSIWSSFKMADQENLRSEIFELIFDKQLKGFRQRTCKCLYFFNGL